MRELVTCLMEHLAKLDLLHGARSTFHQNNPLGSAGMSWCFHHSSRDSLCPQGAQYNMAVFVYGSSSQLKDRKVRHHLRHSPWTWGGERGCFTLGWGGGYGIEGEVLYWIYSWKAHLLIACNVQMLKWPRGGRSDWDPTLSSWWQSQVWETW